MNLLTQIQRTAAIRVVQNEIETERITQFIQEQTPRVTQVTEDIVNFMKGIIKAFQTYAGGHFVFDYMKVTYGSINVRVMQMWEKWNSAERKNMDGLECFTFLVADNIWRVLHGTNYFLDKLYMFKPDLYGKIRYNQLLPFPWTSFMEAPHWYIFTSIFQKELPAIEAQRLLASEVDDVIIGIQELYFPYPFTATALIAGQHVSTFDLHHFEFLGSCSYLLSKDFVGNDFEIVGVYKANDGAASLESVVVHGHRTDVTLHVDGTVETTQAEAKVISEEGYSALKMPNLLVTCSKINRGCSITVTGKYFNRVAGLLGNFNHEPSDDARSPDGEDAYDPADLARMWAVSSYPCYQANQARQLESISDAEDVSECSQLFLHSTSPLSECLRIVDPRPYFTHCINGQSHPAFTDEDLNSPCIAVSSYRTQCWSRGIQLPELEMCKPKASGSCDISGEKVPSGWRHTYQGKTKGSADVALIFELSICTTNKDMQDLFKSIVNQLKKSQIRDVRYAVVTGTAETTSSTGFISKSEAEVHLNTYASDDSTSTTNATSVVSTAQNLEWRPGVSRTIVHLTCQACAEGEAITQALQANDVTYHLITKLNIIMAGPRARSQAMARKVYGFDEKFVFGAGGNYTVPIMIIQ
ncbi:apolipophorins-like [Homarus americanus]|uniref:apolipophorins-like n=1 Tax=Homarus americanus TaxID=6706 RepID=UPI001C46A963|nr:apolipophorins-like [Homarus americanus]